MENKTRTDDMLIEMIAPKVDEIKSKFSSGESLKQEDINTLLLHSQYNHINHLDDRLNQVTADVASLKSSFQLLEQKFEVLQQKFEVLQQKFEVSKSEIKQEVLRAINSNMRWSIGIIAGIVTLLKLLDVLLG